jgi:hypothetical protein
MKSNDLILGAVLMVLSPGCQDIERSRTLIPGVYVSTARSDYSMAEDTLEVFPSGSELFRISRRVGFRRIDAGRLGERECLKENWQAVYNVRTQSLEETRRGKLLRLELDSARLWIGERVFRKLRD